MRVVSWNVNFPGARRADRLGAVLREDSPDLVLLQEVNPRSAGVLRQAAGVDWIVRADEADAPVYGTSAPSHVVAVAGYGPRPRHATLIAGVPHPFRILLVTTAIDGAEMTAGSYHAPPGASYGIDKARQAVAFARWLAGQPGPLLFGADANTPEIDAHDFADTRTHWHTGCRKLLGEPGDDLLFGPGKIHLLDDALRRWLTTHPDDAAALRLSAPLGPLAITHRTGRRNNPPQTGIGRRYDSIWVSRHWAVRHIHHHYEEHPGAASDHARVVAEMDYVPSSASLD
jgi:hypothetical protein